MSGEKLRTVVFYKNHFSDFFKKQKQKVKDKILWTLRIIENQQMVASHYLKCIHGPTGLYEIRVRQGHDSVRIFCFFDKEKLVIVTSGFLKKTQKTPHAEIEKAQKIKADYEREKKRHDA